jgi:hypothetical protein
VYRFDTISGTPTLGRTFLDPAKNANDHFGFSMALVGSNEILIGAPGDSTFGSDAGAVYLFNSQTGDLLQTFYGPNPHAGAQFGFSVADIDAHSFMAGAPSTNDDTDPGAAYLMEIAPMVTVANGQVATVDFPKIPGPQGATIQAKEGANTGTQTVATFGAATFAGKTLGTATIDWGDGMTDNVTPDQDPNTRLFQVQGSHTYAEEGDYSITVTIKASDGSVLAIVNSTANVADPGIMIAQLLSPQFVEESDSGLVPLLTFTDPGEPEALSDGYSAEIDWGDNMPRSNGTIQLDSSTGIFTVLGDHPYQEEGAYPISVTMHHDSITSFISGVSANVTGPAVVPLIINPTLHLVEGTPTGGFTLLTFADPAGPEPVTNYPTTIDWGDQTTSSGTIQFDPSTNVFTVTADHPYREEGNYVIDVIVNHDGTGIGIGGIQATVADAALVPQEAFPVQTLEGTDTGLVPLLTFTDPGGPEALGDYSATIAWGDGEVPGNPSNGTIQLDPTTGIFSVLGHHQYPEEGNFSIQVTVSHEGNPNFTSGITATVLDAPLHSTPARVSAIAGGPFSGVVASFTDSDPNGTLSDYSALIIWGDTLFAYSGTITANGSGGYNVVGSHTYSAAGDFRLIVEVFDTFGGAQSNAVDTAVVTNLGQFVQPGLTSGIGFWHSRLGQRLINSFNGGSASTALSSWLVATFPNLYGITTGANDLTGFTNAQVGAYYQNLFSTPGPKLAAEILGVALDVYATTQSLGGSAGTAYGFNVTTYGLGAFSYNVGSSGVAFGVADNTVLNVFQILKGVNFQAVHGLLYDGNRFLDMLALAVFDGITTAGSK